MTWDEICDHPDLRNLPFRIESNRWGQIVMYPPSNDHYFSQASIRDLLRQHMTGGHCLHEANVVTRDGTKVSDGAWLSEEFYRAHKGEKTFSRAPEIVVEVKSPGNTMAELLEKKELFLDAGAGEVWIRKENGSLLFYDQGGLRERSALCPDFPVRVDV